MPREPRLTCRTMRPLRPGEAATDGKPIEKAPSMLGGRWPPLRNRVQCNSGPLSCLPTESRTGIEERLRRHRPQRRRGATPRRSRPTAGGDRVGCPRVVRLRERPRTPRRRTRRRHVQRGGRPRQVAVDAAHMNDDRRVRRQPLDEGPRRATSRRHRAGLPVARQAGARHPPLVAGRVIRPPIAPDERDPPRGGR